MPQSSRGTSEEDPLPESRNFGIQSLESLGTQSSLQSSRPSLHRTPAVDRKRPVLPREVGGMGVEQPTNGREERTTDRRKRGRRDYFLCFLLRGHGSRPLGVGTPTSLLFAGVNLRNQDV